MAFNRKKWQRHNGQALAHPLHARGRLFCTANRYVPQTSIVDAGTGKLNLTSSFTYEAVGNLTLVDGSRTDVVDTMATGYDTERCPVQTTDAAGKLSQTTYNPDGRPTISAAQIGTQWLVSCVRYSETGKALRVWGPAQTAAATTCPAEAAPVPIPTPPTTT